MTGKELSPVLESQVLKATRKLMNVFVRVVAQALFLISSSALYANKTYTPVPSFVFSRKTVFIENKTGDATLQHAIYLEFARWGRLDVVESREKPTSSFASQVQTMYARCRPVRRSTVIQCRSLLLKAILFLWG